MRSWGSGCIIFSKYNTVQSIVDYNTVQSAVQYNNYNNKCIVAPLSSHRLGILFLQLFNPVPFGKMKEAYRYEHTEGKKLWDYAEHERA